MSNSVAAVQVTAGELVSSPGSSHPNPLRQARSLHALCFSALLRSYDFHKVIFSAICPLLCFFCRLRVFAASSQMFHVPGWRLSRSVRVLTPLLFAQPDAELFPDEHGRFVTDGFCICSDGAPSRQRDCVSWPVEFRDGHASRIECDVPYQHERRR